MRLSFCILSTMLVAVCNADRIRTNADDSDGIVVIHNKPLVLNCSTSSEVPSETVSWYKSVAGGERTLVEADSRIQLDGGLLTIPKPIEEDAGNYTCIFATAAVAEDKEEETIHVVTNVTVAMPSTSINKQEDENLLIICKPYGKPTPTVTWTKDGQDVLVAVSNASARVSLHPDDGGVPDAKLEVTGLMRPEDAGDYCCHAENVANAAQGCIIIRVKDKYAALWPFIGIVAEVILLTAIIYIYEKKKSKPDMDDSDTDNGNDRPEPRGDVRQRK